MASAGGATPGQIARQLRCASATARNAIHAFVRESLAALQEKSHKPRSTQAALGPQGFDALKELLHRNPRALGKATGLWTLDLLAEVCHAKGWTPRVLTKEGMRLTLKRLGIGWKRAKHWITSPDPAYARKKARDRLIRLAATHPDWVLGFQDECWWSRLAQPARHAWTPDEPLHLIEEATAKGDPNPKALACYGLLRYDAGQMLLRFVRGRPVSQVTEEYLGWACAQLAAEGKNGLLLVWDNASWHNSPAVRA